MVLVALVSFHLLAWSQEYSVSIQNSLAWDTDCPPLEQLAVLAICNCFYRLSELPLFCVCFSSFSVLQIFAPSPGVWRLHHLKQARRSHTPRPLANPVQSDLRYVSASAWRVWPSHLPEVLQSQTSVLWSLARSSA